MWGDEELCENQTVSPPTAGLPATRTGLGAQQVLKTAFSGRLALASEPRQASEELCLTAAQMRFLSPPHSQVK